MIEQRIELEIRSNFRRSDLMNILVLVKLTIDRLSLAMQRKANVRRKRRNLGGKMSRLTRVFARRAQSERGVRGMTKGLTPQEGSSNRLNFSM